jgi:uncharacterized protein (DUF2249 family)
MESEIKINVCGLEPPEPMERALDALSRLNKGQRLCMLIDREPRPFYRILDQNGYCHSTVTRPDYLYEVSIWKDE